MLDESQDLILEDGMFVDRIGVLPTSPKDVEVELDNIRSLPTMGDDFDDDMYFDEDEEAPLIDCAVERDPIALANYARSGNAPEHLSIVNFNEFADNTARQMLKFKERSRDKLINELNATWEAVERSDQRIKTTKNHRSNYEKFTAAKREKNKFMEIRLGELQDLEYELSVKQRKLTDALIDSDEQVMMFCLAPEDENEGQEVQAIEDDEVDGEDELETEEERDARIAELRIKISVLTDEIESLPPHLRAEPQLELDATETELLKATLHEIEDDKLLEEAKMKIGKYELTKMEMTFAKMDPFKQVDYEPKLEAKRKEVFPDNYPDPPEETEMALPITVHYEQLQVHFRVAPEITFAQLIDDAVAYFKLDAADEYCMTKWNDITNMPSERKQDIYPHNIPALSYLANLELFGTDIMAAPSEPEIYMRVMVDNVDPEVQEYSGRLRPILPPLKTLTIDERVAQTLGKRLRQLARRRFIWYSGFLVTLIVIAFAWIPVYESYVVRTAIHTNLFEEDFSEDMVHFQKGFKDIATSEEMYDYLLDIFVGTLNLDDGGVIADNTRVLGGLRVRQQRVSVDSCEVSEFAKNWTKQNNRKCYGPFGRWTMDKSSFGPCHFYGVAPDGVGLGPLVHPVVGLGPCDIPPPEPEFDGEEIDTTGMPTSERRWQFSDEWFGIRTTGQTTGIAYPSGGYVINYGLSENNVTMGIKEMMHDGWVDLQTRLVMWELLCYNQNTNLFILVKVLFEFDANGLCTPSVQYIPFAMETEISYSYQFAKIVYVGYIIFFYYIFFHDLSRAKADLGSYVPFFANIWNCVDFIIYGLCFTFQTIVVIYALTPSRLNFRIDKPYYQDMNNVANYSVMASNMNAIVILMSFLKLFKFMNLSDQVALMTNTIINAFEDIFVFLVMLIVIMVSFAVSANMIFGSELMHYCTLGKTMNTLFRVQLGDFDYEELSTISAVFALIWFALFQLVVFLVMINVFIGIISESFCAEHAKKRSSLGTELGSLFNSLYKGVAHRTFAIPPDPNAGHRRPFFDPVLDDLRRHRTTESQDRARKAEQRGFSYRGTWGAYRGLPTEAVPVTAAYNAPVREDK